MPCGATIWRDNQTSSGSRRMLEPAEAEAEESPVSRRLGGAAQRLNWTPSLGPLGPPAWFLLGLQPGASWASSLGPHGPPAWGLMDLQPGASWASSLGPLGPPAWGLLGLQPRASWASSLGPLGPHGLTTQENNQKKEPAWQNQHGPPGGAMHTETCL